MNESSVSQDVRDRYASVARSQLSNDSAAVRSVAMAFGYSPEDLDSLPAAANMGLSCGNPLALAGLREGEVVVDLGCGGGLDVFLAAAKVGERGRAIGIDMTAEMLARARAGAEQLNLTNTEFHQSTIDRLPLPDASVDCVISNCVINLAPDKAAVFREIFRVLKPGGRLAVSDIGLKQPLPEAIRSSVEAYVGCIAGALPLDEYQQQLVDAGFEAVTVSDTGADLSAYTAVANGGGCCGSGDSAAGDTKLHDDLAGLLQSYDVNDFAASVRVYAVRQTAEPKPADAAASVSAAATSAAGTSRKVRIYDQALCCSTGVCGPQVDPVLPKFAADLDWLKRQGHDVVRWNLAQDPAEFAVNPTVQKLLADEGVNCLPLVIVDERIVSRGEYPSRQNLALWTETPVQPQRPLLPVSDGGCCGTSGCC